MKVIQSAFAVSMISALLLGCALVSGPTSYSYKMMKEADGVWRITNSEQVYQANGPRNQSGDQQ